jgi:hypothetical protein
VGSKQVVAGAYLANLVSVAEVIDIVSAGVMFFAADKWMHGTRFSAESRNRRDVSSAILDLKDVVHKSSRIIE